MRRRSWLGVAVAAALLSGGALARAAARPAERASPPPQINPKAVVWRTPTPPKQAEAGDVWVGPDGAEMVYVAAGEFVMGSPEGVGDADEHPLRRVSLSPYWIDKNLVTVAQYRKFCRATGRKMPLAPPWGWQEDHPVVNETWSDARDYAAWAGKRLPTEAEWEKAARGADGRVYPWGNQWDATRCANAWNSPSGTKPVGSYPAGASPYGVLDMAGNVWQWGTDWYGENSYRSGPTRNPTGLATGKWHVLRGGSWECRSPMEFRSARRDYEHTVADENDNYDGIRCVRNGRE